MASQTKWRGKTGCYVYVVGETGGSEKEEKIR
jgi:hypothetical protein